MCDTVDGVHPRLWCASAATGSMVRDVHVVAAHTWCLHLSTVSSGSKSGDCMIDSHDGCVRAHFAIALGMPCQKRLLLLFGNAAGVQNAAPSTRS